MSQRKVIEKPLQKFVVQARKLKDLRLVEVIKQVLDCVHTFVFDELLECPNVIALENTCYAPYLHALRMFSKGTYLDYLCRKDYLPELNERQIRKLQYLSIVALAKKLKRIPYEVLLKELNVDNVRDLEDLIFEAISSHVISGEIDEQSDYLIVNWTVGSDVEAYDVDTYRQWCDSCKKVHFTTEACDEIDEIRNGVVNNLVALVNETDDMIKIITETEQELMSEDTSGPSKRLKLSETKF